MSLMPNMPDLHADTIGALLARGRRLKRAGFMLDEMLDLLGLDEVTWYRYQAD